MERLHRVVAVAALLAACACAGGHRHRANYDPHRAPELGFVAGRTATDADVAAGRALFAAAAYAGPDAEPLPIPVPQYAVCPYGEEGRPTLGVVIQAEQAHGIQLLGWRPLAHDGLLGPGVVQAAHACRLWGTEVPPGHAALARN